MTILVRVPEGATVNAPNPGGVWACTVCGHRSTWTDDHQWYGSLSDIDGGTLRMKKPRPILVTCSDLCRDRAAALGLTDSPRDTTTEAE